MNTNLPKDQASEGSPNTQFDTPEESKLEKRNKKFYWAGICVAFVCLLLTMSIFLLYVNMDKVFSPH